VITCLAPLPFVLMWKDGMGWQLAAQNRGRKNSLSLCLYTPMRKHGLV
jgi:hypothetical protein